MNTRVWIAGTTVAMVLLSFGGCAVNLSGGNVETIKGKEALLVTSKQPPAPVKRAPVQRLAKVVGEKIEITDKVMFDTDEATIKEQSFELLRDVADVMKEHPEITKVSVEGHTDSDGTTEHNQDLSSRRAQAVVVFLGDLGIEESRLQAQGFGEEKPIATNDTAQGKEKNRRVEFNIVERAAK